MNEHRHIHVVEKNYYLVEIDPSSRERGREGGRGAYCKKPSNMDADREKVQ